MIYLLLYAVCLTHPILSGDMLFKSPNKAAVEDLAVRLKDAFEAKECIVKIEVFED